MAKDFVEISCPIGSEDHKLFIAVVNQGIDASLEAFTQSKFTDSGKGTGFPRAILNFHVSELPLLARRLEEQGTEAADQWASDIRDLEEYPGK